jgi:hypothetical protein
MEAQPPTQDTTLSPVLANTNESSVPSSPSTPKRRSKKFMSEADRKKPFPLDENDVIYPKLVDATPKSGIQLLLFELPILLHFPLFFFYMLTDLQWLDLFVNVIFSFISGLICIDMLNRARKYETNQKIYYGIIIMALAVNAFLILRLFGWYFQWQVRQFPVFNRLFDKIF